MQSLSKFSTKLPAAFSNGQVDLKTHMALQGTPNNQNNLEKEVPGRRLTSSHFKTDYKVTVTTIVQYWDRIDI